MALSSIPDVSNSIHVPVLQKEVLDYLDPKPNENFIDCTIGEGGHAFAILKRIMPEGKLLGIDITPDLIQRLRSKAKELKNLILVCDNFANLKNIVEEHGFESVSGILFDLGLSSWHLEKSGKGFSFLRDELLDMRFQGGVTAKDIINKWSWKNLKRILKEYGEERLADRIAKEIVASRKAKPIETTFQLVEVIRKAVPPRRWRGRVHPATKTFQALRIAVNNELENLRKALPQALDILKPEGRMVVISFHSLEDRIVKNFLKEGSKRGLLKILTKKPVRPSLDEIKINPRSRSARLRALAKI